MRGTATAVEGVRLWEIPSEEARLEDASTRIGVLTWPSRAPGEEDADFVQRTVEFQIETREVVLDWLNDHGIDTTDVDVCLGQFGPDDLRVYW